MRSALGCVKTTDIFSTQKFLRLSFDVRMNSSLMLCPSENEPSSVLQRLKDEIAEVTSEIENLGSTEER